jgi:FkbM family methyltransferase
LNDQTGLTMFVSYAQNFEDVMLWRALSGVERGTYVDVGAYHPIEDAVTKAFYDRGWRGINIEPVEELLRRFVEERPRDINLSVALGKEPGRLTLYEIPGTGLSTSEQEIARRHAEQGFEVRLRVVPCTTLDEVLREHRIEEVHFLKVDVEGAERAVLEGASFDDVRPWIVVVEATAPLSPEENHADWEPLLLEKGYDLAYFDGLNRFYVAREHAELKARLAVPPNFFDHYMLYPHLLAQQELEQQSHRVQALESEAIALRQQGHSLHAQIQERSARARALENDAAWLRGELQAMSQSRSWRMTAPLRSVMGAVRERRAAIGGGRVPRMLRGVMKRALVPAVRLAMRSPRLKQVGVRVLATRPGLKARLLRLVHAAPPMPEHLDYGWTSGSGDLLSELPEPARPIYAELQERYSALGRGM